MTPEELISKAEKAMENAYAPYSGFFVGAALLAKSGKVYTGCNVENAAHTPTCCAERAAFFKAVAEGERDFSAMAVCGGDHGRIRGIFPPCGVCRQVMMEFCGPDFPVYLDRGDGSHETVTLAELLPYGFSAKEHLKPGGTS